MLGLLIEACFYTFFFFLRNKSLKTTFLQHNSYLNNTKTCYFIGNIVDNCTPHQEFEQLKHKKTQAWLTDLNNLDTNSVFHIYFSDMYFHSEGGTLTEKNQYK